MSDEQQGNPGVWACFVFPIIINIINFIMWDPMGISMFKIVLFFTVGSVISFIASFIGNKLRLYAMPDSIFTSGGMTEILKAKVWWQVGPQFTGAVIGSFIAGFLFLK